MMERINKILQRRIPSKLLHESAFIDSLLNQLLQSKRLLGDHIELLAQCSVPTEKSSKSTEILQVLGAVTFLSLSAISLKINHDNIFSNSVCPVVATAFATCGIHFTVKAILNFRIKYKIRKTIGGIINDYDKADISMREKICYFREYKFLNKLDEINGLNHDQVHSCLRSTIKIIRFIHNEVKLLESFLQSTKKLENKYEPLEELYDCTYFQQNIEHFSADDFKNLYNIFLYFQSQFILLLCLLMLYAKAELFQYLRNKYWDFKLLLTKETENISVLLNTKIAENLLINKLKMDPSETERTSNHESDLYKVKHSSMDLLCRLYALLHRFQQTNDFIQPLNSNYNNKKNLTNMNLQINQINESLISIHDDFNRLSLTYNNYLTHMFRINNGENLAAKILHISENNTEPEKTAKVHSNNDDGEYFAISHDGKNELDAQDSVHENKRMFDYDESDETAMDISMTRSFFAPVLKQLKNKIDPIKKEMEQREMKFLISKGVDRETILDFNVNAESEELQLRDESESDTDIFEKMNRSKKQKNYDEMRSFLTQKTQTQLLLESVQLCAPDRLSEDILE